MRRRPPRFNGPCRPVYRALNAPENPAGFRPISNYFRPLTETLQEQRLEINESEWVERTVTKQLESAIPQRIVTASERFEMIFRRRHAPRVTEGPARGVKDDMAEPLHVMRRRVDAYCSSRHFVVSGQCNLEGDSGGRALALSQ